MKKNYLALSILAIFGMSLMLLHAPLACAPSKTGQQEKSKEKKVLKTTTDERGFEKELTEVDMMYQTAKMFMTAGQWEKAVLELQQVISAERDRIPAYRDMATCYEKMNDMSKAADAYRQAVAVYPEDNALLSLLGYTELRAQELENAVATYNIMLALDSLDYDANVHLGFIYNQREDFGNALESYRKALKANPEDVPTMGSIAKIYTKQGRQDKAIEMYEMAVQHASDEQRANLLSKLGASYIADKKFDKSVEVFSTLVAENPDKPAHHYNLGISYMQLNKYKEAIPELNKVIELKPDFAGAYQQLGVSYNETKNYTKAIEIVKKGLEFASSKAGLYVTWAVSLEKMKLFDEAIEVLQKAVNDPQYGEYAKKQIARQEKLKIREEKIREQM